MRSEALFLVRKGDAEKAFERSEFVLPPLKNGEVIIESEAFGLNYADVMARKGMYRDAPPMPSIIGYEMVGIVVELGPNANPDLLGKRVVAFTRFGGYAKHVITWDYAAISIEDMSIEDAMPLCTQAVTAYYMAEYLCPVHKGDNVLVHAAAGGVGTILIQLAKRKGATVFAKIGDDKKADLVKKLGADHVINYKTSNYEVEISKILKDEKLDVSFNPVSGSTFKTDLRLLGSGGRLALFGASEMSSKFGIFSMINFARKMIMGTPIGLIMTSRNILGINMLRIADDKPMVLKECLEQVVRLYNAKELIPQSGGVYPIEQLAAAHKALESGKTTGKLIVKW
ncbi:MAG: zinc-binding dehydrogenase [Bacteroidota bacterium]